MEAAIEEMPELPEPPKAYEVFEHTADVGLHAFGHTLPELFVHAAQGMESLLVSADEVHVVTSRRITVDGHDTISLLIAWLNELVFLFDTEYLLFRDFVIETISETQVTGRASGEPYDRQRHDLSSAIKAVTWHEAAITRLDDGYQARIIFDL
ncbi:MAG TPA: archease [Ktedonobacteraceae bacterium]